LWGPEAYRFPERGVGVEQYRERLERAGIDPATIGDQMAIALGQRQAAQRGEAVATPTPTGAAADDPTENPAHFLQLLEELHDTGVLTDDEYSAARTRLLERLRA
jgi:hypothetical protein